MSPSQMARERMAEETARYHWRQRERYLVSLMEAQLRAGSQDTLVRLSDWWQETAKRARYHYREIKAAEERLVAVQLEGFEVESLVRLCRRAA